MGDEEVVGDRNILGRYEVFMHGVWLPFCLCPRLNDMIDDILGRVVMWKASRKSNEPGR